MDECRAGIFFAPVSENPMLRIIPTKVHGVLDYMAGLLLIALPTILGFDSQLTETWVMVILGIITLLYSIVTRYELSFASLISMRTHLWLDFLSGVVLAASPWLFHFSERVYLPHVVFGLGEILIVLLTNPVAEDSPRPRIAPKAPRD